jgi:hypothetical protein
MLAMLQFFQVARVRCHGGVISGEGGRDWFPSVQQKLFASRTMAPMRGAELAATRETDTILPTFIIV